MTEHTDNNLDRIDQALQNLVPEDAPDHLVQSALERVRATPIPEPAPYVQRRIQHGDHCIVLLQMGTFLWEGTYQEIWDEGFYV